VTVGSKSGDFSRVEKYECHERSSSPRALANPDGLSVDERIAAAAAKSYDLAPLRGRMER